MKALCYSGGAGCFMKPFLHLGRHFICSLFWRKVCYSRGSRLPMRLPLLGLGCDVTSLAACFGV